jgi:formylglycine-generating enzyme required for sulfatase activity
LNSGYNLTSTANNDPRMSEVGRYWYNGGEAYSEDCAPSAGTALAGSYPPNAWGLYDMHGNVWEWCLDWYGNYPGGSVTDPKSAASGSNRVRRGGSWDSSAHNCRSAYRNWLEPGNRGRHLGFRLALSSVH